MALNPKLRSKTVQNQDLNPHYCCGRGQERSEGKAKPAPGLFFHLCQNKTHRPTQRPSQSQRQENPFSNKSPYHPRHPAIPAAKRPGTRRQRQGKDPPSRRSRKKANEKLSVSYSRRQAYRYASQGKLVGKNPVPHIAGRKRSQKTRKHSPLPEFPSPVDKGRAHGGRCSGEHRPSKIRRPRPFSCRPPEEKIKSCSQSSGRENLSHLLPGLTGPLVPVHILVRLPHHLFRLPNLRVPPASSYRHPKASCFRHLPPDPDRRCLIICSWSQKNAELIPSPPTNHILLPHCPPHRLNRRCKHLVPPQMTVAVIHLFKSIQIKKKQGERLSCPLGPRHLLAKKKKEKIRRKTSSFWIQTPMQKKLPRGPPGPKGKSGKKKEHAANFVHKNKDRPPAALS